ERRIALKRILPEAAAEEWFLRAFADEARIASQLHHANVVAVLDFGLLDGLPFQALELVEGCDLAELLASARDELPLLGEDIALFIAIAICRALAYVHSAVDANGATLGIVHRDVTPSNVLLSWAGDVKLSDFGIAYAVRRIEQTRDGMTKGTLSYMAPEQVR